MDNESIIKLYFRRDESAVAETEAKFKNYCMTVAYNILGNRTDAEECFNDALLAVWNSIPPNKPYDLGAYLAKVTHNIGVSALRKKTALKRSDMSIPLYELEETLCASSDPVSDEIDVSDLQNEMNQFLRGCSEKERNLFIRRYFFGESIPDIAKKYRINHNTAVKILSRTREKLKKHLKKKGYING